MHQSDAMLAGMDDWNQQQHGSSGLHRARARQRASTRPPPSARRSNSSSTGWSPGARRCAATASARTGASSRASCPKLERFFHYRNLDVSTLKELAQRWAPHVAQAFQKASTHLALDDVRESIRELQYYRERFCAIG